MEQTGVDEVTKMEKDAADLWFTSLTAGVIVGIDKIIMLIALIAVSYTHLLPLPLHLHHRRQKPQTIMAR